MTRCRTFGCADEAQFRVGDERGHDVCAHHLSAILELVADSRSTSSVTVELLTPLKIGGSA
jgi:hypothetical protein